MDSPWRDGMYSPSSACEVAPYQLLEPDLFEVEANEIRKLTKEIADQPYDPELWLYRGRSLRLLGYPELALGDVYKARLLVEAALENNTTLGGNANLTFRTKLWNLHMTDPAYKPWRSMVSTPELLSSRVETVLKQLELQAWTELMESLIASNACIDYLALSQEAVAKFPSDEIFLSELRNAESWLQQREDILQEKQDTGEMSAATAQATLRNGGVFPTAYPWMTESLVSRQDLCFQTVKDEFSMSSSNCTVARSSIRNLDPGEDSSSQGDVFGVFAVVDIAPQETVLVDSTVAGVVGSTSRCPTCCSDLKSAITNSCCDVSYCSQTCSQTALQQFHPVLCGKDLTFLFEASELATLNTDFSIDALLLLRALALAIHESAANPLQTSLISRLTPAYDIDHLIIFSFPNHIITPIRILQALGIDIFANAAYDTWIIHTMRCRLQNNKHGQTLDDLKGTAVNPLYSMFNHSCSPNVNWEQDGNSSTLRLFAERDIVKGEELFISYIDGLDIGLAERQNALMPWLGMDCRCTRCNIERLSEEC